MGAAAGKNIFLLIVAAAIAAVAYQVYERKTTAPKIPPGTPPASAQFLEDGVTAEDLMVEFLGNPPKQRQQVVNHYVGVWVPEPGWKGAVEGSNDTLGTRAVSVYYYNTGILGGGFWVLAYVSDPPTFNKGDHVRLTGQISAIEVLPGGAAPITRIVLDPAKVVAGTP